MRWEPTGGPGQVLPARWVAVEFSSAPVAAPSTGIPAAVPPSPPPARTGRDFGAPLFLAGLGLLALSALSGVFLAYRYLRG